MTSLLSLSKNLGLIMSSLVYDPSCYSSLPNLGIPGCFEKVHIDLFLAGTYELAVMLYNVWFVCLL